MCVFTSYYPSSTLTAAGSILYRKLSVTALSERNVDAAETFQPLEGKFKGQCSPVGGPVEGYVSGVCSSQQPPPNDAIQHRPKKKKKDECGRCRHLRLRFSLLFFLMRIFTYYWGKSLPPRLFVLIVSQSLKIGPPMKYPFNSSFSFLYTTIQNIKVQVHQNILIDPIECQCSNFCCPVGYVI